MARSIFPGVQPVLSVQTEPLPMAREVKWDYLHDRPVLKNGEPVLVEGVEAVKVWAWNALYTVRFRYLIYPWEYGDELETLIGQSYIEETKRAEAVRYVRECLLQSPYITAVRNVQVSFQNDDLSISCEMDTVYGRAAIESV